MITSVTVRVSARVATRVIIRIAIYRVTVRIWVPVDARAAIIKSKAGWLIKVNP